MKKKDLLDKAPVRPRRGSKAAEQRATVLSPPVDSTTLEAPPSQRGRRSRKVSTEEVDSTLQTSQQWRREPSAAVAQECAASEPGLARPESQSQSQSVAGGRRVGRSVKEGRQLQAALLSAPPLKEAGAVDEKVAVGGEQSKLQTAASPGIDAFTVSTSPESLRKIRQVRSEKTGGQRRVSQVRVSSTEAQQDPLVGAALADSAQTGTQKASSSRVSKKHVRGGLADQSMRDTAVTARPQENLYSVPAVSAVKGSTEPRLTPSPTGESSVEAKGRRRSSTGADLPESAVEQGEVSAAARQVFDDVKLGRDEVVGRVQGHRDGSGWVILENGSGSLYLPVVQMRQVLHGDRIRGLLVGLDAKGRQEAVVLDILERPHSLLVGRLAGGRHGYHAIPEDPRVPRTISLDKASVLEKNAQDGQVITVQLSLPPIKGEELTGRVVAVLGDIGDPGMEIEIAVRKFFLPHQFSAAALRQAQKLPKRIGPKVLGERLRLEDVPFCTIDGPDAKDFDDAVYCEPATWHTNSEALRNVAGPRPGATGEVSGFRLLVAIADVAHYVTPESPLDYEARDRATSVYFPRRVIPMLPERLSNDLCSLLPHVDRLVLVCDLMVDAAGEIHAYQFYEAVIRSSNRLTYDQALQCLQHLGVVNMEASGRGQEAAGLPSLDRLAQQSLVALFQVHQALLAHRRKRGAIDLDTVETQIRSDENGRIEAILPVKRHDAHRLIEECMLAANVCAADFLRRIGAGLFRVHAAPTPEKIQRFQKFLSGMGLPSLGENPPAPHQYSALIEAIRGGEMVPVVQTMLLRSLQQAVYSPINLGHFGLAYEAYTHFTSPIRRYADLLTHRVIKAALRNTRYRPDAWLPSEQSSGVEAQSEQARREEVLAKAGKEAEAARRSADQAATAPFPFRLRPFAASAWVSAPDQVLPPETEQIGQDSSATEPSAVKIWRRLGTLCSVNERRADEASRDVESWLKCWYMRDLVGAHCSACITGATSFGLFVTLQPWYVEGFLHISELGNDYFRYDEALQELRGDRTGKTFRLMEVIEVEIVRIDLESRRIDLRMADSENARAKQRVSRSRRKKVVG